MFIKENNLPYIIAEVGFNHGGDVELAKNMIRSAASNGADAVKLQTYLASELVLENASNHDAISEDVIDQEAHEILFSFANEAGITLFSTPFGNHAVSILEKVDTPFYKIASMDLTNLPFIRRIADIGKPILLSTGMGTLNEIDDAVHVIRQSGNEKLTLMHCISHYPMEAKNACLLTIPELSKRYDLPVGYSDHAMGIGPCLAAVSLGAKVIEKHFTTDKSMEGADHYHSADAKELETLARLSKEIVESISAFPDFESRPDRSTAPTFFRSLHAAEDIAQGTMLEEKHFNIVRPGDGLPPKEMYNLIGKTAKSDIPTYTKLDLSMFI